MPANMPTPDSINQGTRPQTHLTPSAKNLSTYQSDTRADVPEVPQTNQLSQLSAALGKLQPTLNQGVAYAKEIQDRNDLIAGTAASEAMQRKNVHDLDEAVKRGLLPAGASPAFLQAVRENNLAHAADKQRQSLNEAYWSPEQADLRASNDRGKFDEFVKAHTESFNQGVLIGKDGAAMYTDLDMARSKYGERQREAINSLYGQHLAYRVGENEKEGEQVASLRTSQVIELGLADGLDHATIAANINAIYRDPQIGLSTHGMKGSKQAQITVDDVVAVAVAKRDVAVLGLLDHAVTPGGFLSGTAYAKKASETARLHITNELYMEGERSRQAAERRGAGVASDPEAEARAKETRDRNEAEYSVKVKQLAHQSISLDKAAQAEPEQAAIIQHLANGASAFDPEVVSHLKNLSKIDATAGQQMMTFVQGQQHKSKVETDEKTTLNTYTRLRADISNDPSKFDRGRIVAEANAGHLTAGQTSGLFDDAEKATKAAKEFPVLHSALINGLRADLKGAIGKDPLSEFGESRLQMDKGAAELNSLAMAFVVKNKEASEWELHQALQPHVERIARKYNGELDSTLNQQADQKKTAAQIQKAEKQTREIQAADATALSLAEKRALLEKGKR